MMTIIQSTKDPNRFFVQYGGREIEFESSEPAFKLDDIRRE